MRKQLPPDNYKLLSLREQQLFLLDKMKEIHAFCEENSIKYYIIAGTFLGAIRHGGFIPWDDDIDIAMMRDDYERFIELASNKLDSERYFIQNAQSDVDFWYPLTRICIRDTFLDFACDAHLGYCKNIYIDVFPLDNVPDEKSLQEKQAKKLKRLFTIAHSKCYSIMAYNSKLDITAKKLLSLLLSPIPLKALEKRIQNVMSLYRKEQTTKVCSMASHYSYKKQTMQVSYYGEPTLYNFDGIMLYGPEKKDEYLKQLYGPNYMAIPEQKNRRTPTRVYVKE